MGRYLVWAEDLGQDESSGKIFAAGGPREAAQQWAEWQDRASAEYSIVGGKEAVATVVGLDRGERTKWRVQGESVPSYRASPVEPDASPVPARKRGG